MYFPACVDLNITAKCNLACTFCWGPDHLINDTLSTADWIKVIEFFNNNGTNSIVFTGGEPLLRKDLPVLLEHCKKLGLHVTLSTNAILFPAKSHLILPFIDEIGIPIDGHTTSMNKLMRIGNHDQFEKALESLNILVDYPQIEVTVRTVVSKMNIDSVPRIGDLLKLADFRVDRWKIYQFTPIQYGETYKALHHIGKSRFNKLIDNINNQYHPLNIEYYKTENRKGRYLFVGPQGDIFGINARLELEEVGNFKNSEDLLLSNFKKIVDSDNNKHHSKAKYDNVVNMLANGGG